jgi:hypothetical protein
MRWARFSTLFAIVALLTGFAWGGAVRASASGTESGDPASPQAMDQYLVSIGVDPGTAIWQVGLRNYVGPACPGAGWQCIASTHTAVVQEAPLDGVNAFTCSEDRGATSQSAARCVVVQVNAGALFTGRTALPSSTNTTVASSPPGNNQANCQDAVCTIVQTNTTGQNQAQIHQQSDEQSGDTQTATETANVTQTNTTGQNHAQVQQQIHQQINDSATTQDQEATQFACIQQDSQSGQNQAHIEQQQQQHEESSAAGVTQTQNTIMQSPQACPAPGGQTTSVSSPNLAALIEQNQQNQQPTVDSGQNQGEIDQHLEQQQQSTTSSGTVTQQQGNSDERSGGLGGDMNQSSIGVSRATAQQNESQQQQAQISNPIQTQFDPAHCCTDQGSNPQDQFNINQHMSQNSGPTAFQGYDVEGDCFTSGTCTVQEQISRNGQAVPPNCTSSEGETTCKTTNYVGG